MRFLAIVLYLSVHVAFAQSFRLGKQASLTLGSGATFFSGGDATFDGDLNNEGTVVLYQDVDFVDNEETGKLKFVGPQDQTVNGDSLTISGLEVDKEEALIMQTTWSEVEGDLDIANGVIETDSSSLFVVTGASVPDQNGFVEGPFFGIVGDIKMTFPVGINGFRNHLIVSNVDPGTVLRVQCVKPDPETLIPTEEMIGIADEVMWIVTAVGSGRVGNGRVDVSGRNASSLANATVAIDFSGVDLGDLPNANTIRAEEYDPAIVQYSNSDSSFHILPSSDISGDERTFGVIESNEVLEVAAEPLVLGVAYIPVQVRPTFYVPTAFAPRGSYDENHMFRPYFAGAQVESLVFTVFDSFNSEVHRFSQTGGNVNLDLAAWDGTLDTGLEAPEGLYYYAVSLAADDGNQYTKSGTVLLVK